MTPRFSPLVRWSRAVGAVLAGTGVIATCIACRRTAGVDPSIADSPPWLWGRLHRGPYAVGLDVVAGGDSSRPERAKDGSIGPRPLELLIWYPAIRSRLTRTAVPFAAYVDLSEGTMAVGGPPRPTEWRRRWLAESVSRVPASMSADLLDRLLAAPMAAVPRATAIEGRMPTILWSTRHATPAAQSVLSEYLASHGYVVAWMRYAGTDSLPPPFDDVPVARKAAVLEAHVMDMQWALRRLASFAPVDSTRLGVAAWSYSGEPARVLAQRVPRIRLLLGLSTNLFAPTYRAGDVNASIDSLPLRSDVAVLEETGEALGRLREAPALLDALPGRVYRITFPRLAHGNFNVLEGMIPGLAGMHAVQPWSVGGPVAQSGYEAISRAVLALLNRTMKGAADDVTAVMARESEQTLHVPGDVRVVRHGPGRTASATVGTTFVEERVALSSERWRLIGDYVRPAAPTRGPAVLMLNKANGDRRVYADLARELALRGIASLRLDLRGHGESTNLGTFVPGLTNAASSGGERDVTAALRWLRQRPYVDPVRIAVVGASYSGELAAVAARSGERAVAYVALSPGSLSERSITSIDSSTTPWWIIVSADERFLHPVVAAVRQRSRTARVTEVDGRAHATDILVAHPELVRDVAEWLAAALRR